jgi:hypothetical protein
MVWSILDYDGKLVDHALRHPVDLSATLVDHGIVAGSWHHADTSRHVPVSLENTR